MSPLMHKFLLVLLTGLLTFRMIYDLFGSKDLIRDKRCYCESKTQKTVLKNLTDKLHCGHSSQDSVSSHHFEPRKDSNISDKILIKTPAKQILFSKEMIRLIEWICIAPSTEPVDKCDQNLRRELIAYHAKSNKTQRIQSREVTFTTHPIPDDFELLSDVTAIFGGYTKMYYPANIYHFIAQYYFPFHHLLDNWKSSELTQNAIIFFSKPLADECIRANFSSFFLGSLKEAKATEQYGYNYHAHPGKVCFRYGMFSDDRHPNHSAAAINHLKTYYNVEGLTCQENAITLLNRRNARSWTNVIEVRDALISAGYTNTSIVDFVKLSLRRQLEVIHCSNVYVAVHGAALQWSYFMRPHSTVIEIAWPKFGWPFYHSAGKSVTYGKVPLNFVALETRNVTNFEQSVKRMISRKKPFPVTKEMLQDINTWSAEKKEAEYCKLGLGRYCNFIVNPESIIDLITKKLPIKIDR